MTIGAITETRQYLTFKLRDEVFALDVGQVREVLDVSKITKIPRTPDYLSGVINLRGNVVPVVDLRLCLDMERTETTASACIVVVEVTLEGETATIGALADSVQEVIELEPQQIQPPPRIGLHLRTDFIQGVGKRDQQFIILLDIDRVFTFDDLGTLRVDAARLTEEVA